MLKQSARSVFLLGDTLRAFALYWFAVGNSFISPTDKFISPKTIRSVCGNEVKLVEDGPWAYVLGGELHTVE